MASSASILFETRYEATRALKKSSPRSRHLLNRNLPSRVLCLEPTNAAGLWMKSGRLLRNGDADHAIPHSQATAENTLWRCDDSRAAATRSDLGSDPERSSLSGISRGEETVRSEEARAGAKPWAIPGQSCLPPCVQASNWRRGRDARPQRFPARPTLLGCVHAAMFYQEIVVEAKCSDGGRAPARLPESEEALRKLPCLNFCSALDNCLRSGRD
jgi:hypothetical protein